MSKDEIEIWGVLTDVHGCKKTKEDCKFNFCNRWASCSLLVKALTDKFHIIPKSDPPSKWVEVEEIKKEPQESELDKILKNLYHQKEGCIYSKGLIIELAKKKIENSYEIHRECKEQAKQKLGEM